MLGMMDLPHGLSFKRGIKMGKLIIQLDEDEAREVGRYLSIVSPCETELRVNGGGYQEVMFEIVEHDKEDWDKEDV